ncbi:MAG: hypothetical protein EKK53_22620 [Burkholderiales bacterium]|nr:MAG: hypothetical protein EKK53_22620 [Burkholderiales bacterium]
MTGLARSALNNLVAAVLPALVMLFTVPILIRGLGDAQYGLLVILSSVTGYLSVLDLNLTAGSIRFLAAAKARDEQEESWQVLSLGAAFYVAIGLLGAVLIWMFAGPLVDALVDARLYARDQAVQVLRITALGFLLGQLYSFLLSVPQALQRYDLSARVEVVNGSLVPLCTAGIVLLGADLVGVTWLRNGAALLVVGALVVMVQRLLPGLRWRWPRAALRNELLAFSGFAYLNRLASLSYQHSDKIVIAAVLDVRQVALYTVPVLLANRIMGTTFRLTQVLFPASSALLAQGRQDEVQQLMGLGMRLVFGINAMAVVGVLLLGDWFLTHWLGRDYAQTGGLVLTLVALGALVDSLTNAPALVTDGAGRTRDTGMFAISRAAVGLLALYLGARWGGIVGVAASHLLVSVLFTMLFLAYFCRSVLPMSLVALLREALLPGLIVGAAGLLTGWIVGVALPGWPGEAPLQVSAAMLVMGVVSWGCVLTPALRQRVLARLGPAGRAP